MMYVTSFISEAIDRREIYIQVKGGRELERKGNKK